MTYDKSAYLSAVLALFIATTGGVSAQAECPTSATVAKGFRMELSNESVIDVAPITDPIVAYVETFAPSKASPSPTVVRHSVYRGLVNVGRSQGDTTFTLTPSLDLATIFPLRSGAVHSFSYTVKGPGIDRTADMTLRVGAAEQTFAGLCPVDVVRVVKEIVWRDTGLKSKLEQAYAPLLQMIIETRGENTEPGKPAQTFAWQVMTVSAK